MKSNLLKRIRSSRAKRRRYAYGLVLLFWIKFDLMKKYFILNNSNPTIYRKLKITIKVSSCNIDYWEILEMRIE